MQKLYTLLLIATLPLWLIPVIGTIFYGVCHNRGDARYL